MTPTERLKKFHSFPIKFQRQCLRYLKDKDFYGNFKHSFLHENKPFIQIVRRNEHLHFIEFIFHLFDLISPYHITPLEILLYNIKVTDIFKYFGKDVGFEYVHYICSIFHKETEQKKYIPQNILQEYYADKELH